MENYELVVIINPTFDEERRENALKLIADLIKSKSGEIISQDMWGRKELAYPIQKFNEGVYVLFNFKVAKTEINDIDYKVKINDDVIRHLLVKKD